MSVDGKEPVLPGLPAGPHVAATTASDLPRVAFIGLGRMGSQLAWRLAEAGLTLAVHDADQAAMDRFQATRVRRARSAEAVVVDCAILVTALPNARITRSVLDAAAPAPGTLVIDLSEGRPADVQALGTALAERGVGLIDAALSGGLEEARHGRLTALVGGAPEALDRARPVLQPLAERIVHCGPLGAGMAMRALVGLLAAVNFAAAIEVMQVGRRFGLDLRQMLDVINASAAASQSTTAEIGPCVLSGRFDSGVSLGQLLQQVTTALAVAQATKTDVPLSRLTGELWRMAEAGLEPGADHTALARWYEHRSGTRLRS